MPAYHGHIHSTGTGPDLSLSHVSSMAPVSPDVALSSAGSPTSRAACVSPVISDLPNSPAPSPTGSSSRFASPAQPSPLLRPSTPSSSPISPLGLDLCIDLSHFSLQEGQDSVSSTQPQVERTHSMVLRPRSSKTANLSALSASRSTSLPQQEPVSFKAADKYLIWHKAMQEELRALHSNNTWSLVPFAPSMNVVGSRWVYKIKRRADCCVDRYKARLVARGFTQQEGVDYLEISSPVIKPRTIRLVLTIGVTYGWHIHQLDVRNAFLNGILQEEVYMAQPPGFVDPTFPSHVCRLHKSLYGLKQAPRAWYNRLSEFLISIGFQALKVDTSLFILFFSGAIFYLLVYVDDILLTRSNPTLLQLLIIEFKV